MPSSVSAVVLTHRRPRLATEVVRSLIEREGLPPDRVVVVVNGTGGLDDAALEASVRLVRLPRNLGPAGGFGAGMEVAFADPSVRWAYLCEDDVGLFSLPSPRLADVMGRAEARGRLSGRPVGAVVAYGRRFVGRGAHTVNVVPPLGALTSWSRSMWPVGGRRCWRERSSTPASSPTRSGSSASRTSTSSVGSGREDSTCWSTPCRLGPWPTSRRRPAEPGPFGPHRPTDEREAWRSYYHARNSILLARRHGRPSWHVWHLAYSARHLQKATGNAERKAILHGLWDGARGRFGENPDYGRTVGELSEASDDPGSPVIECWHVSASVGRRVLDGHPAHRDDRRCRRSARLPVYGSGSAVRTSHATSTAG